MKQSSADPRLSVKRRLELALDGDPQGFYPDGRELRDLLNLIEVVELTIRSMPTPRPGSGALGEMLALALDPLTKEPHGDPSPQSGTSP